jgi:biopolymer transport protein ExbD
MAVARNAVEMRAADELNATVVAVTAEGKLYVGIEPAQLADLSKLPAQTVYVKADARAQYQTILDVLETLRGKRVSLLTASPGNVEKGKMVWPYGLEVRLGQ